MPRAIVLGRKGLATSKLRNHPAKGDAMRNLRERAAPYHAVIDNGSETRKPARSL